MLFLRTLLIWLVLAALPLATAHLALADVDVQSEIVYRANLGRADDVKLLISQGASPNQASPEGVPILSLAAGRRDSEGLNVVKALIDAGANINGRDSNGQTALFRAAKQGNVPIVQYLIEHKIDSYALDNKGDIARTIAFRAGHNDVVKAMDDFITHKTQQVQQQYVDRDKEIQKRADDQVKQAQAMAKQAEAMRNPPGVPVVAPPAPVASPVAVPPVIPVATPVAVIPKALPVASEPALDAPPAPEPGMDITASDPSVDAPPAPEPGMDITASDPSVDAPPAPEPGMDITASDPSVDAPPAPEPGEDATASDPAVDAAPTAEPGDDETAAKPTFNVPPIAAPAEAPLSRGKKPGAPVPAKPVIPGGIGAVPLQPAMDEPQAEDVNPLDEDANAPAAPIAKNGIQAPASAALPVAGGIKIIASQPAMGATEAEEPNPFDEDLNAPPEESEKDTKATSAKKPIAGGIKTTASETATESDEASGDEQGTQDVAEKDEATKKKEDAAKAQTRKDIEKMFYDMSLNTCSFQYWYFCKTANKSTELASEELTIAIHSHKREAEELKKSLYYKYHVKLNQLDYIIASSQGRIYKQLNGFPSNRARQEVGIGKMDDQERRCEEIAREWDDGLPPKDDIVTAAAGAAGAAGIAGAVGGGAAGGAVPPGKPVPGGGISASHAGGGARPVHHAPRRRRGAIIR